MKVITRKTEMKISSQNQKRILYAVLIFVGAFLIIASLQNLFTTQREYYTARSEYKQLRELYYAAPVPQFSQIPQIPQFLQIPQAVLNSAWLLTGQPILMAEQSMPIIELATPAADQTVAPVVDLAEINTDFVGWITIEGTAIDYPIARGLDNYAYLSVSFSGQRNLSGAVFMDYRCEQGFFGPVCILYGHNMRDGSMFAPLHRYLDAAFMEAHPEITVTTPEKEILIYSIFDAQRTDTWDKAYSLDLADSAENRFLILSTCISGEDKNERLLVYAELLDNR